MHPKFHSLLAGLALGLLLLTAGSAPAALAAPPADEPVIHVVQPGETLFGIAVRYGLTLDALIQANRISNPNLLFVGQRLQIPDGSPSAPAPDPGTSAGQGSYTVQPGDTLYGVAARLGVGVAELARANNLSLVDFLYIGQVLKVPGRAGAPAVGQPAAPAPQPSPTPRAAGGHHTVQRSETLYGIAVRYGVTVAQLVSLNGLSNPNLLYVGQRLTLPGGQAQPEATPAPTGGTATPTSTPSPTPTPTAVPGPTPVAPSGEVRGLWVTRWDYKSAADVRRILDRAVEGRFNTVYFQVRGRADAFYRSSLEPWGRELTGTLGQDPGWDPLAVAVEEAHRRGLSLQAYLNIFPAWSGDSPPGSASHPYRQNPDWVVADESGTRMGPGRHYIFFSPAHPGVQDHIAAVVREIAQRYEVDGIHLDYIRYPDRGYSHDPVSNRRYQSEGGGRSREAWQRDELSAFVGRLRTEVQQVRPGLSLTAAVIPVYADLWGWRMRTARDHYYQDWYRWAREGTVDQVLPMVYWNIADRPKFDWIVDEIVRSVPGHRVVVGVYADYADFGEIRAQIAHARARGARGFAVFAYSILERRGYWDELAQLP